jgi:hypothetical protein
LTQFAESTIVDKANFLVVRWLQDSYNHISFTFSLKSDRGVEDLGSTLFEDFLYVAVATRNSESSEGFSSVNFVDLREHNLGRFSAFENEYSVSLRLGN